ncbi:hypothetical protein PARPLA_00894 [Rhodobacteraceae bacterium THAF1]|nr:hypothetical protein FIU81_00555 [Palleronia sp. THAF1]VDC20011.1 hypothetical protein PARPLA_00894 [Rhodobacteraceae bacterium THAF1]
MIGLKLEAMMSVRNFACPSVIKTESRKLGQDAAFGFLGSQLTFAAICTNVS